MPVDPICGMSVETTSAFHSLVKGQTYFFCSDACQRDFENLSIAADLPPIPTPPKSGCCGNGENAQPATPTSANSAVDLDAEYYCPM
jgi:P-type Cu+ transporter